MMLLYCKAFDSLDSTNFFPPYNEAHTIKTTIPSPNGVPPPTGGFDPPPPGLLGGGGGDPGPCPNTPKANKKITGNRKSLTVKNFDFLRKKQFVFMDQKQLWY